tara:strand:- start:232 stop:906 length:675 start_codon:yes stop_codon:yes gene_type:complete
MIIKSTSKKTTSIKICGITQIPQAQEIAKFSINAIGVIGVKSSPRFVPIKKCIDIFNEVEKVSTDIQRVYVTANEKIENIEYINYHAVNTTVLQLHGNESVDYCRRLKNKLPKIKLWKAFRIRTQDDIQNISKYEEQVDAFLLDAWDKNALGGTGKRISLDLLINKNFKIPWILAGGISPQMIPEIFSKIRPDGIDASSSLEIEPGIKDIEKVKLLVREIRGNI